MQDFFAVALLVYIFIGIPYLIIMDREKDKGEKRYHISALKYIFKGGGLISYFRISLVIVAALFFLSLIGGVFDSMFHRSPGYDFEYYRR